MAACGSLQHMIFESPTILPETPTTLLESFSLWNKIKPLKKTLSSLHHHQHGDNPSSPSFTEIFGELHFLENPNISSSQPNIEEKEEEEVNYQKSPSKECSNYKSRSHKSSDSFSSMSSESLQLCTEGLGFESSDEVEDLVKSNNINNNDDDEDKDEDEDDDDDYEDEDDDVQEGKVIFTRQYFPISENNNYNNNYCGGGGGGEFIRMRSSRSSVGGFPPPISCISQNGKPWVCFKSYRHDGRFVLKEIRLPTQEFLHACREDGRLKLHFVITDDESLGEDEEEDNVSDEDEDEEEEEEEEEEIEAIEGDIEAKKTNDDEVL